MTTPIVTTVAPNRTKTWIALAGSILTTLVPIILGLADYIPPEYAWVAASIHAVIGLLTTLGVYNAPHSPADTSIVPNDQIRTLPPETPYTPVPGVPVTPIRPGEYRNPWRR